MLLYCASVFGLTSTDSIQRSNYSETKTRSTPAFSPDASRVRAASILRMSSARVFV
jgi:hypothetical protein